MAADRTIVRGSFRATLALILSIVSLGVSAMTYTSLSKDDDVKEHIDELQKKMDGLKEDSSKKIDALRGETAKALEKLSKKVKI